MGVVDLFLEIDREKFKMALLNSIVNALLVFLVLQFFLAFFRAPLYITLASVPVVFALSMHRYLKRYNLSYLEKENPDAVEMLKTAKDNIREKNAIVEMFFSELPQRVKNISLDKFLSIKYIALRIVVIFVFMMLIVMVPPSDVTPGLENLFGGLLQNGRPNIENIALKNPDDIFGDPQLIKLGDEQIQINIQSSNNEIDFNKEREISKREFTRNPFPVEAEAVLDTPSNEKEPEDFELIKNYNLKIRGV